MTLHLLSLDFRHAPLALREQVAFVGRDLPGALHSLRRAGAEEAAILSTCNRVELVAELPPGADGRQLLLSFLASHHDLPEVRLDPHLRYLTEGTAARHLIAVACGLESLVPGEMQILGQVKGAAAAAREAGTLGTGLDRLFAAALGAGRRARRESDIARRPVSISHAAVSLIQQQFGADLTGRCVLLIGSGKMGEIAAQQLHRAGADHFIVANRTLERACELAQRWHGTPLSLDEIPATLAGVDAVIAATGAPHLILHASHVREAMARRSRPLLLIDLAVPRDIDPDACRIPGVTLCDVDGLQGVVAENIELRNGARTYVETIVAEELARYLAERAAREVAPTIVSLRRSAEEIRKGELEKALGRLRHLGAAEREVIEALTRGLMNKWLHEPTSCLREKAAAGEGERYQVAVEELFALREGE